MAEQKHLWKIDHPYYGADGYPNNCDSFAELKHQIDAIDEDMNHVYRWDWLDYNQPHHDTLFLEGEFRDKQRFKVYLVMPRKSAFLQFECPITHDQEAEVLAWLRSDRVLGAMRRMWEPIFDQDESAEADR